MKRTSTSVIRVLGGAALAAVTGLAVACSAGGSDTSLWQAGDPPPGNGAGGAGGATASNTSVVGSTATSTSTTTTTTTVGSTTTTTTQAASSAASSSSSSGGGVTWTTLYNGLFGQSGTSTCNANSSCHQRSRGGFACGTSKTTCYSGFVSAGWITPGANASQSALVDPNQSCLCGSLGGDMPRSPGHCPTATDVQNIKSWLATGAPDN